MAIGARTIAVLAGAATLAAGLGLALARVRPGAERPVVPAPPPPPRELCDLAVGCLALGEVRPAVPELGDEDLDAVVSILARLIGAYERADYGSFLALRSGDLGGAGERRAGDLETLRTFARDLRVPEQDLASDWLGVLARFWEAYYGHAAVARFVPERTRVELHSDGLGGRSLEEWEDSFLVLRDRVRGPWIQHALVVPHRRAIERIASDPGPLRWIDLELGFETRAGMPARLVARFVHDGALAEWYLHAAATVYTAGDRSERHLIL